MAHESYPIYVFGEFSLDPEKRIFSVKGDEVHLPAKEFDTLLYFVENRGRTLPKEELMSAIWSDTFVEESNLAQYVSRLRKVFNTNGHNYIQTLPKKGYRFDADVKVKTDDAAVNHIWKWALAAGTCIALILTTFLIYVLQKRPVETLKPPVAAIPLTDGKQDDGAVEWTSDNHIRFFRRVSPKRYESWIMNLDGSDQHREATPVKDLQTGFWSPDGKKVYFMKEGDGKTTYLANSDGSSEIALPLLVGNSDWSPDSSQIVYETKTADGADIYLYTPATHRNIDLTPDKQFNADPSFSPDGKTIYFVSGRDGNIEIYSMDLNGENIKRLTDHPAFDNFPTVPPDGTQLFFLSNRDESDGPHFYERDLGDDSSPRQAAGFGGIQGVTRRCWSPDGTQVAVTSDMNGKDQIFLLNIESPLPEKILSDPNADLEFPKVSRDGKSLAYQARLSDGSIELRTTDLVSNTTTTIYKTEPNMPARYSMAPSWSADGEKLVFSTTVNENSDVYIIDSDGTGLERLTDDPLPDILPVFSADGSEIFFVRDLYGRTKLFVMNRDGSSVHPIMQKNGYEMTPAVSPDGQTLLFSGDRQDGRSKGFDIFAIGLAMVDDERQIVSRPLHDTMAMFSPDGKKIAFTATGDGNAEIYVMNADGSDLYRLTRNKADDEGPSFSGDGKSIFFGSDREGKFAIYRIALGSDR